MASRSLPIDARALLDATTSRDSAVLGSYLDLRTGAVFQLMDPALSGVDNEAIETAMDQEPERFARVPLFDREYRLMCAFVDEVEDERLACALDQALRGRGAFQGFHEQLQGQPEVLSQWERFRSEALLRWLGAWLSALGIAPGWQTAAPGPRLELHHLLALGEGGPMADGLLLRWVELASVAEARRTFKRFAQQLCEYRGEPWRPRLVLDGDVFERDDLRLRLQGARVIAEVRPDQALLSPLGLTDPAGHGRYNPHPPDKERS